MSEKIWLITGCSSGIGQGIAKAALATRDKVVLTARNTEKLKELSAAYPEQAVSMQLDVTDIQACDTVIRETIERFGRIDVLVNNAGYGYRAAVEESEDAEEAEKNPSLILFSAENCPLR